VTNDELTYGPQLPDESSIHLVLSLALRIGEVQMASGAGASDVTATILGVTYAYGLSCEVDVIFTSITVSCHRGSRESRSPHCGSSEDGARTSPGSPRWRTSSPGSPTAE
jgi:uncharacterized membrane protein YjjP (DUF1212 family)